MSEIAPQSAADAAAVSRRLTPLVWAVLALLLLIVGATGWAVLRQDANRQAVRDTFRVDQRMSNVLSLVQDAETGQRGFLLTQQEAYLEPYNAAAPIIAHELDEIGSMVADNPGQLQRLAQLREATDAKLEEMAGTIREVKAGREAVAMFVVATGRGKELMDSVRAIIGEMREEEARLLDLRMRAADNGSVQLRLVVLGSALLVLGLGALIFFAVRRFTFALVASRDAIGRQHEALQDEMAARRKVEGQLVQSQKMEAVGQLTGGLAHDFNNMMAVVISALGLMRRRLAAGDRDVDRFVDAAMDGATRAAGLTNRLLAFSRLQPLQPEVLEANRLVANMSELLHRTLGEQIHIETVLAAGLWRTRADPSQLENSVLNLAVNARDAMPGGGRITIETANCHLDDAYVASNHGVPPGQYVLVAVSDTGPGMTQDVLEKAFEPFFTTKPVGKGTGLGLSQVYGFVKQSGGHIKIYSELGSGTVVKIYLPRVVAEKEQAEKRFAEPAAAQPDPATVILVVEDDDHVRNVTVATLRELGYIVIHASRPSEALEKLKATPRVDLMFTDVVMPEMSGRKLADEALKLRPGLKLLFTTGYTQNAIVHNGVLDPGTDLIMKPFSVEQVGQKIAAVLARG